MTDCGLAPWQCQNIWIHTHPGNCPNPSGTDENNFSKNFSHPHWAIFFIIADGGKTWCEIQFNVGPTCRVEVPVHIDYKVKFNGTKTDKWQKEYELNVSELIPVMPQLEWSKLSHFGDHNHIPYIEDDMTIDDDSEMFEQGGLVWYWDEESDNFYVYDPVSDEFRIDSSGKVYKPHEGEKWAKKVKRYAKLFC